MSEIFYNWLRSSSLMFDGGQEDAEQPTAGTTCTKAVDCLFLCQLAISFKGPVSNIPRFMETVHSRVVQFPALICNIVIGSGWSLLCPINS